MLELGKHYQQRDGLVVGPLETHKSSSIGFEDYAFKVNGSGQSSFAVRIWKANGSFHINGSESAYDLISEVKFVPLTEQPKEEIMSKPLKLEVGKYYEDREGEVIGPIKENKYDEDYPFICDEISWAISGKYCEDAYDSMYDLIKEVPNPNQENELKVQDQNVSTPIYKEISLNDALIALKNKVQVRVSNSVTGTQFTIDWQDEIHCVVDATKFEIEVKPVVKYRVVYSDVYSDDRDTYSTAKYYETVEDFYSDYDQTQYPCAELIQFTRREF